MTYVYPVVSRRAGGVSVGINLNPNNACNWRCVYCQVPNLTRGGPPQIDLDRLENELRDMLTQIYRGDFLLRHAPPEARRVVDIAFSGNGEPTSATEFPVAVDRVIRCRGAFALADTPLLRLITNGSLIDRLAVRKGVATLGAHEGEIWFKVDAIGGAAMRQINGVAYRPEVVLRRLRLCGSLCPTWIQTCLFAVNGQAPDPEQLADYTTWLGLARQSVRGVHLYGLARPSLQPGANRLSRLPVVLMEEIGAEIARKTGLTVKVSP